MVSAYMLIGVIGIFLAGLGLGFAVFSNISNPYPMMYQNPQGFNQMVSSNPQFAGQYMVYMMHDPALRQQMYNYMFQNHDFMYGMMRSPLWQNVTMSNPQLLNQWMSTMMQNPQFRQQYLGPQMMLQNPQVMRNMMNQWYGQQNLGNLSTSNQPVESDQVSIVKNSWQSNSTQWYLPDVIRVKAGTTITWTNDDTIIHTVTDVGGTFDSGIVQPNTSWNHTFDTKGQFQYFCTLHPWMKGEVIVR